LTRCCRRTKGLASCQALRSSDLRRGGILLTAPPLARPEGLGTFTVPRHEQIAHPGDGRLIGERDDFGPHGRAGYHKPGPRVNTSIWESGISTFLDHHLPPPTPRAGHPAARV